MWMCECGKLYMCGCVSVGSCILWVCECGELYMCMCVSVGSCICVCV